MAYILAIETATEVCSVALFQDNKLINCIEEGGSYGHAEKLASFTKQLLQLSEIKPENLSAIALGKGPGSYTGLRIGTSFAKGMCFSLNIPLIAISTLEAFAYGAKNKHEKEYVFCPLLDARRMEVYTALYSNDLVRLQEVEALVVEDNPFEKYTKKSNVLFFGNGAEKCEKALNSSNSHFDLEICLSAKYFGELAFLSYKSKDFVDVAYFEPFYLKDFLAVKSNKAV